MMNTGNTPQNDQNLPCGDLLENIEGYSKICVPLYHASIKGDWEAARVILEEHQQLDLLGFAITESYDTALHIASSVKSSKLTETFVENQVNKMTKDQLALQNKNYNTALSLAAAIGNTKIAVTMVEKNKALLDIPDSQGMMPLYTASLFGQSDMVNYLYDNSNRMTGHFWTDEKRSSVLLKCVEADMFDVALKIETDWPELTANGSVLGVLARTRSCAFKDVNPPLIWRIVNLNLAIINVKVGPQEKPNDAMQLLTIIWTNIMKLPKATIDDIIRGPVDVTIKQDGNQSPKQSLPNLLFIATEMGNTKFVVEAIRQYPDLMWRRNGNNQTIFHVAVSHRCVGVYSLVHETGLMKDMITSLKDEDGNNMLHLVGKLPKINGLQLQRELMWFKEVKELMPPCYQESKNKDGLTPHELFMVEHKDLLSENKKLMKDMASQCLVVAALIAAIGFTLATTVPGGYDQKNGIPVFSQNPFFVAFTILDAISLIFSTTSILIFLSIFIYYRHEHEFLRNMPMIFAVGVATLNYSIGALLFGFSVSFFLFYHGRFIWVPILISMMISIPLIHGCIRVQLLFFTQYDNSELREKRNRLLYQNPSV